MPYLKLATNQFVQLRSASITIGSDPTCDLSLTGKEVLPRHIILQPRTESEWQAATLSPNASFVINNHTVDSLALLKDGDQIRIGDVTLVWRKQDAPAVHSSPWKGLLTILLAVLLMLGAVMAWFGLSHPSLMSIAPDPSPSAQIASPTLHPSINDAQQPLTPVGFSKQGHPLYHITVPTIEP